MRYTFSILSKYLTVYSSLLFFIISKFTFNNQQNKKWILMQI